MKKIYVGALAALMVLMMQPARAGSQTITYVGGFGRLVVNGPTRTNVPQTGVAGFSFTVATGDPATLKIADQSGPGTAIMICQEAGAVEATPGSCEDGKGNQLPGDDTVQKLCANGSAQALSTAFVSGAGKTLGVFVYAADYTQRGTQCTGVGTTGTLTLTH